LEQWPWLPQFFESAELRPSSVLLLRYELILGLAQEKQP